MKGSVICPQKLNAIFSSFCSTILSVRHTSISWKRYISSHTLSLANTIFYVENNFGHLQGQRSLRESQEALLKKVEELTEQLKQERERALVLEGQLTTSTLSLQTVDKVYICVSLFQPRP